MTDELSGLGPDTDERLLRRAYERHLDLLLAEELECRPAFARWFIAQADLGDQPIPDGDPASVTVRVSHVDGDVAPDAAGEDDLRVEAEWADGRSVVVLVEDKLDAVLQERQIERLVARAETVRASGQPAGALVIAPRGYLDGRRAALGAASQLSIDEIAQRLEADAENADGEIRARLVWRARNLVVLKDARRTRTPDHEPTISLRDWLVTELAAIEPTARPFATSMRTVNTTWLYFAPGNTLIFKIPDGVVDIYPQKVWPDYDPNNPIVAPPRDFHNDEDSVKNLVLRWKAPTRLDMAALLGGERPDVLRDALHACAQASRWIDEVLISTAGA